MQDNGFYQAQKDGEVGLVQRPANSVSGAIINDETPVYISVETEDVDLARRDLSAGVTLLRLGMPGDHSIDDNAVGLLTWAISE